MLKTFSGRNPSQNEYEFRSFIEFLKKNKVTRYLEIGCRHGDAFHEVMSNLPEGSYGVAVDLPGGLWGRKNSMNSLSAACQDLANKGYVISMIFGDSTDKDIIEAVKELGPFDAILIDGDHTYEGVKKDWENYQELGKYIAFHDIVGTGMKEKVHNNEVEVPILWEEIKQEHQITVEYVDSNSNMGIGICVLR